MPTTRPEPRRAAWRCARRVLLAAAALLVVGAGPAAADAAGPGDFRSEVTEVEPATDAVDARIRGGDSFLEISASEGVEVLVEGYRGEPYLRFNPDGTVERNRMSPATYLNEDRKGAVDVPAGVSPDAEPEWEQVADDGTYAWHDHRVHWMSEASPPVERGERVPGDEYDPWVVPLTVDGEPVEVRGILVYEEAVSPLPWIALAVVEAVALVLVGRRSGAGLRLAAGALLAPSVLAVVVGWFDYAATPDGGGNVLLWVLPAAAAALAAVALAAGDRGLGGLTALAAVAALSGWALLRLAVLLEPVLPTELPFALDRAAVALALGSAVGCAYLAVTSSALALPELADD